MTENIDLYVYKELNSKVGKDIDKNGYFKSLEIDDRIYDPRFLEKLNVGPATKLYTFQEQPSSIPSLANNCLVFQSKNFSPKNIRISDDNQSDEDYIRQRGYKFILLYEHEHVTTKNKVKENYEYFVTGNYMFISAKTYESDDDLRTVFHIDSAPSDFPNIIISTGYIIVCSKTSLNTLINKAKTSTTDTVYLATLDTSTGTPRNPSIHPLAATDDDGPTNYTNLRATGVMYSFYEVAKIFLDDALKPVSLAIVGNNLCLFRYNYRVYFKAYYFDRNTRIIGLTFHWFCGPEITSLTRLYDSELTYDRTVPFVFTNTSYQYSNMYTPLFFTKNYDDLVQGKLIGIREVMQPMSLDINNGNKTVTITRITSNGVMTDYKFSASDNSDYYHFSPGNVINKLQNNIPYPLNSNVFIPNVCSADEHFPQALVDSQAVKYIHQGDYTIYKCKQGTCDSNGDNCSPATWDEFNHYTSDDKPIDINDIKYSKKISAFDPNFYAVVPTFVEDDTASDSKPESNPGSGSGSNSGSGSETKQDEESSNGFMSIIRALFYSKSDNNEYTIDWAKIAIIAAILIVIIVAIVFVIKGKSSF